MSSWRAISSSSVLSVLTSKPWSASGATNTSPGESTTSALPEYLPVARVEKSFQLVTGSLTSCPGR